MSVKIETAAYSSIGGRGNNEDNFYLNGLFLSLEQMNGGGKTAMKNTQPVQLYAVLDGMGGGDYGEYASSYAAGALKEYQDNCRSPDDPGELRCLLQHVSQRIDAFAAERGLASGSCGSTVAMLVLGEGWYRTAHVGDSRVYLLRGGELTRLTKDQSLVQQLVDAGQLTEEEAWESPDKNIITHHLGMPLEGKELEAVISDRQPLQAGDCFLLCSDGVSDNLRDREIAEVFLAADSAEKNAERLVQTARRRAGEMGEESDNLTAVVLKTLKTGKNAPAEGRRGLFGRWLA